MKNRHLKRLIVLVIFLMTFLVSCNSLSFDFQNHTPTTTVTTTVNQTQQNDTSLTNNTSSGSAVYNLTGDELSAYLATLDTTDPVVAASIVMPSVVELTVDFQFSYTATYRTPWGTSTQNVTDSATAQATGFFINSDGNIMTNAHVVTLSDYEGYPDFKYISRTITFNFADSKDTYTASIVDYDTTLDLAVLHSDTPMKNQSYLTFFGINHTTGVSLYYGESVIAVGNANGYGISVTSGIISAPLRYFEDGYQTIEAIQTDAAINEGNSGGPLTNLYGAVVGIDSFKIVTATSESLGYAIPANVVMSYLDTLGIHYDVTTDRAY